MNTIDSVRLLSELEGEHCGLNHGPETKSEDYSACDYIVIPFGDIKEEVAKPQRDLIIPVCHECAVSLIGHEWTLLYCFECNASRWVYRPLAKNDYRHHILWLRGCPDCTGKFGGLYFNDFDNNALSSAVVTHLSQQYRKEKQLA